MCVALFRSYWSAPPSSAVMDTAGNKRRLGGAHGPADPSASGFGEGRGEGARGGQVVGPAHGHEASGAVGGRGFSVKKRGWG